LLKGDFLTSNPKKREMSFTNFDTPGHRRPTQTFFGQSVRHMFLQELRQAILKLASPSGGGGSCHRLILPFMLLHIQKGMRGRLNLRSFPTSINSGFLSSLKHAPYACINICHHRLVGEKVRRIIKFSSFPRSSVGTHCRDAPASRVYEK
jgi:hypothetical protein